MTAAEIAVIAATVAVAAGRAKMLPLRNRAENADIWGCETIGSERETFNSLIFFKKCKARFFTETGFSYIYFGF